MFFVNILGTKIKSILAILSNAGSGPKTKDEFLVSLLKNSVMEEEINPALYSKNSFININISIVKNKMGI